MKKTSRIRLFILVMLVTFVANSATVNAAPKKNQTISASNKSFTIGSRNKSLGVKSKTTRTYKSSNSSVVSINRNGYVTAKKIGSARVTIQARASSVYRSSKKVITVSVVPRGSSIASVSAVSGTQLRVKYTGKSGITGYQVRYSTSSRMKSPIYKYYSGRSPIVGGLRSNKRYYVQVRTYKKVGSKNYFSSWSKIKYANTKKVGHSHVWKISLQTIKHPAIVKKVDRGSFVQTVIKEAWSEYEPNWEIRTICSYCGADVSTNAYEHLEMHANEDIAAGYHEEQVDMGGETINYPAVTKTEWVPKMVTEVVKEAWTEKKTILKCSCGNIR